MMPRSVVAAVGEPNSVPLMPPIWVEPPPPTLYWNVVWPAENTALPDTEMLVKVWLVFWLAIMSPM